MLPDKPQPGRPSRERQADRQDHPAAGTSDTKSAPSPEQHAGPLSGDPSAWLGMQGHLFGGYRHAISLNPMFHLFFSAFAAPCGSRDESVHRSPPSK